MLVKSLHSAKDILGDNAAFFREQLIQLCCEWKMETGEKKEKNFYEKNYSTLKDGHFFLK